RMPSQSSNVSARISLGHRIRQAVTLHVMWLTYRATATFASSLSATATLTPTASDVLTIATHADTPPGSYAVSVQGSGIGITHFVNFTLIVGSGTPPTGGACGADAFEPNGSPAQAYPISSGGSVTITAAICAVGDLDWYKVSVPA